MTSYEETVANLKETYAILCGGSEHDVGLSAYSAFRCQCAVKDALELLKEQAPVKPVNYSPYGCLCGRCLQPLEGIYDYRPKYCPNCGREVNRDADDR